VFRTTSVAGTKILRATVRSKVAGWLVSATVPLSYVEAARRRGELFGAAFIVTAMTVGGVLAYIFGGFMARPLDAATAAAEAVGAGQLVQPLRSPLVEANQLTSTLSAASAELAARQEHSQFLMRELAHRSKNQLAVVKGMALQTASQSRNVDEFVRQFSQRIQGLAESQDLMVGQNWQGAWLRDLVRAHIDLFGADARAEVQGPALFLNANAVQNIGFALHELATNASKHGALNAPEGRVLVNWRRSEGDRIRLEWVEMGGPAVTPPQRRGFGSLVITELVAQALNGTAKLDFLPTGVHWQLDIPATHVLTTPAARTASA
jgi:two-component sensor histidine kinase